MKPFWVLYAVIAVLTAVRAGYGMYVVRDRLLHVYPSDAKGIAYLAMFVSALAMGLCWFLYWPALGAVALIALVEKDDDENDDD